ncbi:MAG TPA: hypothetical protein VI669_17150, partial [Vicinamibacteria bacterium]
MAQCPACRRPVAMARPLCLYCGAALPAESLAAAITAPAPPPSHSKGPAGGTLLVVDCSSTDPASLGEALGLLPYESVLRHRRGGYALEGVLDPAVAEEAAARLSAAGLVVFLVPESLTRAEPWLATGGALETGGLRLRGASGARHVSGPELLLVVRGPIVREYQAPFQRRKVQTARLEDGYRFHLHLRASEVLEIDPGDFDFETRTPVFGSSRLEIEHWIDSLARGVTMDDAFRHSTPALGPVAPGSKGPLAAAAALSRSAVTGRPENEATVHDNLRQFRFYSAWRG